MAAKKRLYREYDTLATVDAPRKFARLHGLVTELTDMMTNNKYFEGRLADD